MALPVPMLVQLVRDLLPPGTPVLWRSLSAVHEEMWEGRHSMTTPRLEMLQRADDALAAQLRHQLVATR